MKDSLPGEELLEADHAEAASRRRGSDEPRTPARRLRRRRRGGSASAAGRAAAPPPAPRTPVRPAPHPLRRRRRSRRASPRACTAAPSGSKAPSATSTRSTRRRAARSRPFASWSRMGRLPTRSWSRFSTSPGHIKVAFPEGALARGALRGGDRDQDRVLDRRPRRIHGQPAERLDAEWQLRRRQGRHRRYRAISPRPASAALDEYVDKYQPAGSIPSSATRAANRR